MRYFNPAIFNTLGERGILVNDCEVRNDIARLDLRTTVKAVPMCAVAIVIRGMESAFSIDVKPDGQYALDTETHQITVNRVIAALYEGIKAAGEWVFLDTDREVHVCVPLWDGQCSCPQSTEQLDS
jgi:tRNA(Arg) A34 adenosine deaminase TadA